MTIISGRGHEKFMEVCKQGTVSDANGVKPLQEDTLLLQQLYDRYQNKLFALRRLIQEYETVQRRVRKELRKKQTGQISQETLSYSD